MSGSTTKPEGGYFSSNTSLKDLCNQNSTMYLDLDELVQNDETKQPEECPTRLRYTSSILKRNPLVIMGINFKPTSSFTKPIL